MKRLVNEGKHGAARKNREGLVDKYGVGVDIKAGKSWPQYFRPKPDRLIANCSTYSKVENRSLCLSVMTIIILSVMHDLSIFIRVIDLAHQ